MVLISYIIPAYNARPYLQACLDSIFSIDLGEYGREVIVCDDGSTDGTDAFLNQLKNDHNDLVILHQENAGLGAARNHAIDVATGKYICLVDADDKLHDGAQKFPYSCLANDDVDLYGIEIQLITRKGQFPYRRYEPIYNKVYRPAKLFMQGRNLMPCPWAYIYRRDFIIESGLRFHEGIWHEDEEWAIMAFAKAASFVALRVNYYCYFVRPGSITTEVDRTKQQIKLRHVLGVIESVDAYLRRHPDLRPYMSCKLNYLCVDLLRLLYRQRHGKAFRQEIIGSLRRLGYFPLMKQRGWKYKIFRLFTKCIS